MFTSILRRRMLAVLAAGAAAVAVLGLAVPAGASPPGPRQTSPEMAGYTVTGNRFKEIHPEVWLRDPAQYAGMVARYRHTAQLWSSSVVVSVDATARTSGETYTLSATIYDASTHQVIAFNPNAEYHPTGQNNVTVPGVGPPLKWGQYLSFGISYTPTTGDLHMYAVTQLGGGWTEWNTNIPDPSFTEARIGTGFGRSPWDASYTYTPPTTPVKLAYYYVYFYNYAGIGRYLSCKFWMHHKLLAQPPGRGLVAIPHDLTGRRCNFQTWFVPSAQGSS